jgi:hypothetical protein
MAERDIRQEVMGELFALLKKVTADGSVCNDDAVMILEWLRLNPILHKTEVVVLRGLLELILKDGPAAPEALHEIYRFITLTALPNMQPYPVEERNTH